MIKNIFGYGYCVTTNGCLNGERSKIEEDFEHKTKYLFFSTQQTQYTLYFIKKVLQKYSKGKAIKETIQNIKIQWQSYCQQYDVVVHNDAILCFYCV